VLPVHNQADHIAAVIREYEGALARIQSPHELILVPNACTDGTEDICRAMTQEYPSLRVVPSARGGWGLAVRMGLAETHGDTVCYTNSARTSAENLMLLLLYAVAFPEVVVKANRKIRDNARRRLGSLLYNLECRALFDLSYWDINGTPKVFPRSFDRLLHLTRDDDLIDAEFNAVCRYEEYPMIEVPIFSTRRKGGKSTTNLGSALNMYMGAFQMRRSWKRDGEI
jgi:glycosyltransferase involved in cell wall biosynthesis